jgi:hypothetical protein
VFTNVDSYCIQYSYFVDRRDPEFKAGWNELYNNARVYTPDDAGREMAEAATAATELDEADAGCREDNRDR